MRPSAVLAQSRAARANSSGRIPVRPWSAALLVLLALSCAHAPGKISFEQAEQEQFPPELRREALLAKPGPMLASAGDFLPRLALTAWPSGTGMAGGGNCSSPSASCSAASFTTTGASTAATFAATTNGTTTTPAFGIGNYGMFKNSSGTLDFDVAGTTALSMGAASGNMTATAGWYLSLSGISTFDTLRLTDSGNAKTWGFRINNDTLELRPQSGNLVFSVNNGGNGTFVGQVASGMGSASGSETLVGAANIVTTGVGNSGSCVAGVDLISYSLPANAINSNNRGVRVRMWGTTANNATAKTIAVAWGGQNLVTKALTVSVAGLWEAEFICYRTGASTQDCWARAMNYGGTTLSTTDGATVRDQYAFVAGTQTDTAAIAIKGRCITNANAASDIVQEGQSVEFFN